MLSRHSKLRLPDEHWWEGKEHERGHRSGWCTVEGEGQTMFKGRRKRQKSRGKGK